MCARLTMLQFILGTCRLLEPTNWRLNHDAVIEAYLELLKRVSIFGRLSCELCTRLS